MKTNFFLNFTLVTFILIAYSALVVSIEVVPVGNIGNSIDLNNGLESGAVDYNYEISKYEITATEYTEFLNAIAATDNYGLYDSQMGSHPKGCKIVQSGTSGSYTYTTTIGKEDLPVNFIGWGDAVRFANWMHNGQPTGAQDLTTTEDGAYYINGATTATGLSTVTRKSGWKWAIPTEDEWYKAAYHKNDGVTANYWLYPTTSDAINTSMANYNDFGGSPIDVGTYSSYPSPYGTFDQGGNVAEWTELRIDPVFFPLERSSRGGSYNYPDFSMMSSGISSTPDPSYGADFFGIRVVYRAPSSSSWIDDDFIEGDCGGHTWGYDAFDNIQDGIDAVASSGTVIVAAGIYTEQLHITTENLTITGSDVDEVIIQSPVTLTEYFATGSNNNFPIIFIDGVDDFSISDLTVDGDNQGDDNYRFVGLAFWNSGGSYANGKVINIMNSTFSGAQHGTGIYAYNDTDGPYNIILNNVDVYDFQKTAVALSGEGLTVDLDDVSTIGEGPTDVTAQNGIQLGYGASGTVDDCEISEIAYTGPTYTASGILIYNGISVVANNVDIDNCQTSVYYQDTGGSFSNGTITDCLGDALYLYAYADVRSNLEKPLAYPLYEEYNNVPSREDVTLNLTNTVITGADLADSWGPGVIAYPGFTGILNIQNCTVTNWDYGIVCYEAGGTAQLTANNNEITDNISYGYYSNAVLDQDASDNWWGDPAGPAPPASRYGNAVVPGVIYEPWWIDEGMTVRSSSDVYVDAAKELIQDNEQQTYGVVVGEIADLRGFEVEVSYPKVYFSAASNFMIGIDFSGAYSSTSLYPVLIDDGTLWKYKVTGTYNGAFDGIDGEDVVLFTFNMTSLANADNVPLGSVIDIYDVELKDDNSPYSVIPFDETIDKTIIVDAGEPTMIHINAATYPTGMLLSVLGDGSGLLDRPTMNFTFTDNYNLDDVQYLIQDVNDPAPTAFSGNLIVDDFSGLTTTMPWQLPTSLDALADGTYTIYYLVLDDAGNYNIYDWDFIKDTTAPEAITWVQCRTTVNGINSIDLEWSNPAGTSKNHIWALSYADLVGVTTGYPEFTPIDPIVIPAAIDPYDSAMPNGWTQIEVINANTSYPYIPTTRGYYYITIYAEDASGNISAAPAAPFHRESISYWLGDVDGDGYVTTSGDIFVLSAKWGLEDGEAGWSDVVDVGPTIDNGRRSLPTPDDVIDIEDLMIIAMNYHNTNYNYYQRNIDLPEEAPILIEMFCYEQDDVMSVDLKLSGNNAFLKGINIPVEYDNGLILQSVEIGDIWPESSLLLHTDQNNIVEISASTMGSGSIIEGDGTVCTLNFELNDNFDEPELLHMIARTIDNQEIEIINNPTAPTGNDPEIIIPENNVLISNYPNPFNPTTTISYGLKENTKVRITLYNIQGQKIRTLVDKVMSAGNHQVFWNGKDENNKSVASGVYFYSMKTKDYTEVRKAMLLK